MGDEMNSFVQLCISDLRAVTSATQISCPWLQTNWLFSWRSAAKRGCLTGLPRTLIHNFSLLKWLFSSGALRQQTTLVAPLVASLFFFFFFYLRVNIPPVCMLTSTSFSASTHRSISTCGERPLCLPKGQSSHSLNKPLTAVAFDKR